MANKRLIPKNFFEDDFVGSLTYLERYLLIGLIVACADDQGRFLDNLSYIRAKVFVFDENVDVKQIENGLDKMIRKGTLHRYQSGDTSLLQFTKWWKHQRPAFANESDYPPPPNWTDRVRVNKQGIKNTYVMNWDEEGGFTNANHEHHQGDIPIDMHIPIDKDNDYEEAKDNEMKKDRENQLYISNNQPGELIHTYSNLTNIHPDENNINAWIEAENRMIKDGITPDDLIGSINELQEKGYQIPASFEKTEKSAKIFHDKRQKSKPNNDYRRFFHMKGC